MRILRLAVLACVFVVPAMAGAKITRPTDYDGQIGGGEITVAPASGYFGVTGQFADRSLDTFQTFCVEFGEGLNYQKVYEADFNTVTVMGGNKLTPLAAAIYHTWRYGQFPDDGSLIAYDYDNSNPVDTYGRSGRAQDAAQLQAAVWAAMGTATINGAQWAKAKAMYDYAVTLGWTSIQDVRVLNIWSYNQYGNGTWNSKLQRYDYQDLVTLIPAPGAGLLGFVGLAVIGVIRRR